MNSPVNDSGVALPPQGAPCVSCPYRRDVPSGVWADTEYAKLELYDAPTYEQPPRLFMCHQDNGHVCAGWAGCHDGAHLLSLRLAEAFKTMTVDDIDATIGYVSPVPLFGSGREAAEHGRRHIDNPSAEAVHIGQKIERKRFGKPR